MSTPPWVKVANSFVGTKEYPGAANNPTIMRWAAKVARYLGINYAGDHVPWCGLFVAYCVAECGLAPAKIAVRASEWSNWGVALREPTVGAVLTFNRSGGGHVAFYVSEDRDYYHVLGGNQSDAVNITKIAKNRCTAFRWPAGVPLPKTGRQYVNRSGPVSDNEA